ncbi:TPA: hypothetical protein N0F65_012893 [Lagenidium giganteum]|uniref:BZIP domain-containing protein n=1 Tax=Lagenidium giganteum TaxID=4803 RepID=A0AAV2YUV8_9STRA|nr:TPA: hypothetical protein N0F65_012893 [Lagenidium giganteum]
MDAFHNLLREAQNPTRGSATSSSLPSANTLSQALQAQAMSMTQSLGGEGMNLPMGMSLPLPMGNLPGSNSLAPLGRLNPMMGSSPLFPNLTTPSMSLPMPSASSSLTPLASASTTASASASPVSTTASTTATKAAKPAATTASKKRKAPPAATPANNDKDSDGENEQPTEYEDPKAKRRAQIAKAARKHRQRQKDELIALRSKVKDLKEQIEVLQSSEPSEHNTELGWKQEAEQHAEIRARVDQENEFLRKTLMEQMKFIQRLQDYFAKQPLLNMPSLDLILNSTSSSATASTLSSTIASSSSTLQLQSTSFQDQQLSLANEAMLNADKQLQACEIAFRAPKNPTMTYFGLQVQYDLTKDEMAIFFRHQLYNCSAKKVIDDIWDCVGDSAFEKKFPFVDSVEQLEELDSNSRYFRRVVTLTVSNDNSQSGGTVKEEGLFVIQKRENPDGSIYVICKSVNNDPSHPQTPGMIRRNQVTTVSLRDFADATGNGCSMLWSARVYVDKDADERTKNVNIPDIILKNLFEIAPVFVKGVVDKARASATVPLR